MIDLQIRAKENCTGCNACSSICPQNCIAMISDNEGFWYPKVNYNDCIKCKLCIEVCPTINQVNVVNKPKAYASINKNDTIRLASSSGGIFTLVAEQVIDNGGVVFGVEFDENFKVIHSYVENKKELNKFRGSKYVQSNIGNNYIRVKDFLEQGRKVLFTGTPCQIGGLKSYLSKDYNNLFTMDNICHGVPSPKVWDKYVKYREDEADSSTEEIAFRNKNDGWKLFSVSFSFTNETEYIKNLREDIFMRAFLKDVCLRPSCYNCKFKTLHRESDITLADFWGIQGILPDMDDDRGTSLIFINSDRGQSMFEKIQDQMLYKEVDINQAVSYNSAAIKSVERNINRDAFLRELDQSDFDKLVKKYCRDKLTVRVRRKIISIGAIVLRKTGTLELAKSILGKN